MALGLCGQNQLMLCRIVFPPRWIDATHFETALRAAGNPHDPRVFEVHFSFPPNSKLMIDAALRLLSLANQLILTTRRVRLDFEEGEAGTMGYLNRIGFFDFLHGDIAVAPYRPTISGAALFRGGNIGLVEIAKISKNTRDQNLPSRLTDALMRSCSNRADKAELQGAAWTIFAELIDNVFSHSETPLDGYAALQAYQNGDRLTVAVSDSGLGILQTLRPSLQTEFPRLLGLSDTQLLVEIFRQGLSRHGADRGCGLKGSAAKAMKFNADLDVRLPNQRVLLTPARGAYEANTAYCYDNLPLLWGTHISFGFRLKS